MRTDHAWADHCEWTCMFSQVGHIHVQNNNYSVMYEGVAICLLHLLSNSNEKWCHVELKPGIIWKIKPKHLLGKEYYL